MDLSAGMHVSPLVRAHVLPPVADSPSAYFDALLALVRAEGIDVVFPLSDADPLLLAERRSDLEKLGCTPIVGSAQSIECCDDKLRMSSFCETHGLATPRVYTEASVYDGPFPVVQKPIRGSGSGGMFHVTTRAGLTEFVRGRDLLQPYVDGDEFGLDILNALDGAFVAVCVKRKLLMRAGETDKAEVVRDEEVEELGRRISRALRHVGNLDCDVVRAADGRLYCLDLNPRFGGGYPATHLAGLNYLEAVLAMVRGERPQLPVAPRRIVVMKGISLYWCDAPRARQPC
jgi:carbamoyl-phosphate synthase large subunit